MFVNCTFISARVSECWLAAKNGGVYSGVPIWQQFITFE